MSTYTLVKKNADDTEFEIATELAGTPLEALIVFGKTKGINRKLEFCRFENAEYYLKWLNTNSIPAEYMREPVRSVAAT